MPAESGPRRDQLFGQMNAKQLYDEWMIGDEPDPQNIRDTFQVGDGWVRIRVTEPADRGTATVTIQKAH